MFDRVLTSLRTARAATAAATVLLLLAAGSAQAAEKGVVTDMTWGISRSDQDRTAAVMQAAGAKWSRINISWSWVNPTQGTYDQQVWNHYDHAVSATRGAGAKVILMAQQAPQWASGTTAKEGVPRNPADYAEFLKVLLARYPGQVDAVEVWNEQNTQRFWPHGVNAGEYAQLLKAAHGAVKSVDPNVRVLFGGTYENDYGYLEAAYAAMPDLGNYFDAVATHPYTAYGAAPDTYTRGADGRITKDSFAGYREMRATMAARGTPKPIWFTEWGWATTSATSGVSEAVQADYLTRALRCVEQDHYVEVATWYNLRNNYWAADANNWEDQLGLLRTDFSPKPAYTAFASYAPGLGGCAYREAGAAPSPTTAQAATGVAERPAGSTARRRRTTRRRTLARITRVRRPSLAAASRRRVSSRRRRALLRVLRRSVTVNGIVRNATGRRVVLRFQRRIGKRGWRTVLVRTARLSKAGRFTRRVRTSRSGRWRVRAEYRGTARDLPARSPFRAFRR